MLKSTYNTFKLGTVCLLMTLALVLVNVLLLLNVVTAIFSRRFFYHIGALLPRLWCCLCLLCCRKYLNFRFICRAPKLDNIERATVIANHQSMLDIAVLYCFAAEFGKGQHPRWMAKRGVRYLPLLGWGGWLSGTVLYLHRDWGKDRKRISASFRGLTDAVHPFWLCFFPEGTRFTYDKLQASQHYAREKNYPVLHQVLLPRPKGFTAAVQGLRAHIDAVLDVCIHYSQPAPFFAAIMQGKQVDITVQCSVIEPASLPRADAELKQSLLDIYQSKDQHLAQLGR